jgi:hypothetical protein
MMMGTERKKGFRLAQPKSNVGGWKALATGRPEGMEDGRWRMEEEILVRKSIINPPSSIIRI